MVKIVISLQTQRSARRGTEKIATRVPVICERGSIHVPQSDVEKADSNIGSRVRPGRSLVRLTDRTAGAAQRRRNGTQPAPAGSFLGEWPSEPAGVQPARTVGPGRRTVARSGR